jgi:hypothetical protein
MSSIEDVASILRAYQRWDGRVGADVGCDIRCHERLVDSVQLFLRNILLSVARKVINADGAIIVLLGNGNDRIRYSAVLKAKGRLSMTDGCLTVDVDDSIEPSCSAVKRRYTRCWKSIILRCYYCWRR